MKFTFLPFEMRQQMKSQLQYYKDNQGFRIKSLKEKRKVIALLFSVSFIFISLSGFVLWRDYVRSSKWIDAPAQVMYTNVVPSYDTEGTVYRPRLEYTYVFNEKPYRGEWTRELGTSDRNYSRKFINLHPIGSNITIKVDPENPRSSIVPVDDQWLMWLVAGVGVFLIGVAIYILIKYPASKFKIT